MSFTHGLEKALFSYKDFSSVDQAEEADFLISALKTLSNLNDIKDIKKSIIQTLNPESNQTVIEFGSGLGDDANILSNLVGKEGKVTAIESSKKMISEAQTRYPNNKVEYIHDDIISANLMENSFDIVYADRLLISQKDVKGIIKKAKALAKPQAKICFTDLDFGTIAFSPHLPRLTNILIDRYQEIVENPFIGRQLVKLFKEAGLLILNVIPQNYLVNDLSVINSMMDIPRVINDLFTIGRYDLLEKNTLLNAFYLADKEKTFFYSVTLFTVIAMKL